MKFKDFLTAYLGSNHDVDEMEVWIWDPEDEDVDLTKIKKSLRNYILFGDYYVTDFSIDHYPYTEKYFLAVIICKEDLDPLINCPFAVVH